MTHIDWEAQNDHDLLVSAVIGINGICDRLDKMNGTIQGHENHLEDHSRRITTLEVQGGCEPTGKPKIKVNWQIVLIIGTLAGGMLYAFGCAYGWW